MYTFIYFTFLVFKLWQKQFSQKLQFCEDGIILKGSRMGHSVKVSRFLFGV